MLTTPPFLTSSHPADVCRNPDCSEMVKQNPATGRWFVTMGHCQFNSRANNAGGYATEAGARKVVRATLAR